MTFPLIYIEIQPFTGHCLLQNFREAAYIAENRTDLLDAILDYLDESLVLPSGDWDKSTLLPVVEKAKKKAKKHIDEEEEVEHGLY